MHRLQHFVGHGGGPGDRQEFPAGANDHFSYSFLGMLDGRDAGE